MSALGADGLLLALSAFAALAFVGFAVAAARARLTIQVALCALMAMIAAALAVAALGAAPVALVLAAAGAVMFALALAVIVLTPVAPPTRPRRTIAAAVFAALIFAALGWAAQDVALAPSPPHEGVSLAAPLALLPLVGAVAAYALLGFGERAVFPANREDA